MNRTTATIAALVTLAAPLATAVSADAAPTVHHKSFACHTSGAYASSRVHGTVDYAWRVVSGKVKPVSARFVGTGRISNPQPRGRTQTWDYRNASVSRDNGGSMHTSSANPVTFSARYGYLPASPNNTTVTGRWTYRGPGGTHVVPCTARISIATTSGAQQAGVKWE